MILAASLVEQYAPLGGALLAVVVASGIALKWWVPAMDTQADLLEDAIERDEICEYRLDHVVGALVTAGVQIPPEARGIPPHIAARRAERARRERRRRKR